MAWDSPRTLVYHIRIRMTGKGSRYFLVNDNLSEHRARLKVSGPNGGGPALMEDHIGREKLMRIDHERIPERVVCLFRQYLVHRNNSLHTRFTHAGRALTDTSGCTAILLRSIRTLAF
jgi:hypothetical protein